MKPTAGPPEFCVRIESFLHSKDRHFGRHDGKMARSKTESKNKGFKVVSLDFLSCVDTSLNVGDSPLALAFSIFLSMQGLLKFLGVEFQWSRMRPL